MNKPFNEYDGHDRIFKYLRHANIISSLHGLSQETWNGFFKLSREGANEKGKKTYCHEISLTKFPPKDS